MSCMKCLSKYPYSMKLVLPRKIPGCAPVTVNLTFHPNFHPNILLFANLPIYRKLIHDNRQALRFENEEIFVQYYFKGNIKYCLYIYKYMHQQLIAILKKIYIIFICKYRHYNLCQCYFEEYKNQLYSCVVAKIPKRLLKFQQFQYQYC